MNQEYVLWGVAGLSMIYTAAVIAAPFIRAYRHREEHKRDRARFNALGKEIEVAMNNLERTIDNFGNSSAPVSSSY